MKKKDSKRKKTNSIEITSSWRTDVLETLGKDTKIQLYRKKSERDKKTDPWAVDNLPSSDARVVGSFLPKGVK